MSEPGASRSRGSGIEFVRAARWNSNSRLRVVERLAERADVFVQNFRPGAIERMGLGEERVRALSPRVVYVSISGFGESGPFAHQRVYDPVIQALPPY